METGYDMYADVRMDVFEQSNPVWIAGSAFKCFADAKKGEGWTGIFCQDRDRFPSRLGRRLRHRALPLPDSVTTREARFKRATGSCPRQEKFAQHNTSGELSKRS